MLFVFTLILYAIRFSVDKEILEFGKQTKSQTIQNRNECIEKHTISWRMKLLKIVS